MKKEIKTAVIYARYSSDNQSEQSIDGQLRVCNEYAKNNDIIVLDTYIDRALSAKTDNRPAFQQMIKDSGKRWLNNDTFRMWDSMDNGFDKFGFQLVRKVINIFIMRIKGSFIDIC